MRTIGSYESTKVLSRQSPINPYHPLISLPLLCPRNSIPALHRSATSTGTTWLPISSQANVPYREHSAAPGCDLQPLTLSLMNGMSLAPTSLIEYEYRFACLPHPTKDINTPLGFIRHLKAILSLRQGGLATFGVVCSSWTRVNSRSPAFKAHKHRVGQLSQMC